MAIKLSFRFLLFLFLFFFQTIPTMQLMVGIPRKQGPREPHYLPYKPKENSTVYVLELEKLSNSLWDSGYKIMSLILKRQLPNLIPYGFTPLSTREILDLKQFKSNDWMPDLSAKNLTLYDRNTVTVFAPPDKAFRLEPWMSVDYQVVLSKFDQEAVKSGMFPMGMKLATCDYENEYVVVTRVEEAGGVASVNNVKITEWNIYNDGHFFVHGVEDFFHPFRTSFTDNR